MLKDKLNNRISILFLISLLTVSFFSACTFDEIEDSSGDQPSTDPYAYTQKVKQKIYGVCSGCHGAGGNGYLPNLLDPGKMISDQEMSQQLDGGGQPIRLIVPGHPEQSLIYLKVSSGSPPMGVQMPQGQPALSAEYIQAFEDWIANMPPE